MIIYTNRERGIRDGNSRNEALSSINDALEDLERKGSNWSEKRLHSEIKKIVGEYGRFIDTKVNRKKTGPHLSWRFNDRKIREAERTDGTYILLSTDETLSAKDVVNQYLEKDFIEKVFRTMKTTEEVEPVRHRLEVRVRAYLFVCLLAYRLLAYLQHKMGSISKKNDTWERADSLLDELGRVERMKVKLGHQVKTWYLNIPQKTDKTLKEIGMGDLFVETTETDFSSVGGKD